MKNNQSLHLTIKQPPDPNPVRSLGVFDDITNTYLPQLISNFLSGIDFEPKSPEFVENVKDEVLKLLTESKPIAVAKQGDITIVYFQ